MIVIPMAGLSRRFIEAGYNLPKYMLEAHGRTLFAHSVGSFSAYFTSLPFLFIARDVAGTADFIARECAALGISTAQTVVLNELTAGQAATVALGLARAAPPPATPITIFNIDTFRPAFRFPTEFDAAQVDGYLEVFSGTGSNWSYVRPATPDSNRVLQTTEKVPISDLCCTGLYHFRSAAQYLAAYADFANGGAEQIGLRELYVAPMYNLLIAAGADIRYDLIDPGQVTFCGVPTEYDAFLAAPPPAW